MVPTSSGMPRSPDLKTQRSPALAGLSSGCNHRRKQLRIAHVRTHGPHPDSIPTSARLSTSDNNHQLPYGCPGFVATNTTDSLPPSLLDSLPISHEPPPAIPPPPVPQAVLGWYLRLPVAA